MNASIPRWLKTGQKPNGGDRWGKKTGQTTKKLAARTASCKREKGGAAPRGKSPLSQTLAGRGKNISKEKGGEFWPQGGNKTKKRKC